MPNPPAAPGRPTRGSGADTLTEMMSPTSYPYRASVLSSTFRPLAFGAELSSSESRSIFVPGRPSSVCAAWAERKSRPEKEMRSRNLYSERGVAST